MSLAATQVLAYLLGLGLLLIVLRMIWRPAMPATPKGRIVATVLAVAIWVAWVVGAGLLMMLLLVGSALAVTIPGAHRAVLHLFRPVAPADEHAAAAPLSVWAVVVDRGVRALLLVGGIWLVGLALGLDVVAIVGRDTPAARLLNGAAHAIVILLVADLLWQLARTVIDRRLQASARGHGHGGERGPELAPEEARRLGRIRTLLPILRIVLGRAGGDRGLMALSALGVQIAR